ncbi:uncharacterized protein A4U43_C07F29330 [Asparagus officinalis]|uniref:Uncharacterized protein n=1 Tax=Asparagus officinalis TaxID=4686 RepID=A0A5P1EFR3_ASPOF|nr:uncharacterized protein A4U43_C07F29330 [Asparagus officinalis]
MVGSRGPKKMTEAMMVAKETETLIEVEVALDKLAELAHQQGKEPATERVSPIQGFGWSFPYYINEVEIEKWDHLRMLLMGSSQASPSFNRKSSEEFKYEPRQYLDKRGIDVAKIELPDGIGVVEVRDGIGVVGINVKETGEKEVGFPEKLKEDEIKVEVVVVLE